MSVMASQITGASIVCSSVCSGADQRKHQSSTLLVFVRGIHRWPVNYPHKWPVTRKIFPLDDVIMVNCFLSYSAHSAAWSSTGSATMLIMMGQWCPASMAHLWGKSTGDRYISSKRASNAEPRCFLWCTSSCWTDLTVIWDAMTSIWRHCNASTAILISLRDVKKIDISIHCQIIDNI